MYDQIKTLARSRSDDLVKFLRELIAIPSVSGHETKVIERIRHEMEMLDYDTIWVDPFGNLFGQMGSGKRLLAMDGHCDTVDVGNPDNWTVPPFGGDLRNGTVYGRGAADQKGGLASAVYAGKILKDMGIPEDVSLLVVASVCEEDFEGLCWQYIVEKDNIQPEAVLLTEPTNLGIRIGQRGRLEMKVTIRGISCHGSAPERGENAIYKAAPIIQDIEELNRRLSSRSILGKGSVTITDIRSTAPSLCAVADRATLHLDRRLTEGETMESAVAEICNLKSVTSEEAKVTVPEYEVTSYTGVKVPVTAYYPMWLMEKSHPLVRSAVHAHESLFQKKAAVGAWIFSTNGVATNGLFDIPTVGFGPGEERYAHTPEDQVKTGDLVKAAAFYVAFILEWSNFKRISLT